MCLGLGYDFLTRVRTSLNSDGVRGSSGWWLEVIGEKVKKEKSKKNTSFNVEAAMDFFGFFVHVG